MAGNKEWESMSPREREQQIRTQKEEQKAAQQATQQTAKSIQQEWNKATPLERERMLRAARENQLGNAGALGYNPGNTYSLVGALNGDAYGKRIGLLNGLQSIINYAKDETPDFERTRNLITEAQNNLLQIQKESAGGSLSDDDKKWYEQMETSYTGVLDYLNNRSMRENTFEFKRNREDLSKANDTMGTLMQRRNDLQAELDADAAARGTEAFLGGTTVNRQADPRAQEIAGLDEQIAQQQSVIESLQQKIAAYQPNTNDEREELIAKLQDPHAYDRQLDEEFGEQRFTLDLAKAKEERQRRNERRTELRDADRARLKELDESLYNESKDYTAIDRAEDWLENVGQGIGEGLSSTAGTALRALDESAMERKAEGDGGFLGDRSAIPGLAESDAERTGQAKAQQAQEQERRYGKGNIDLMTRYTGLFDEDGNLMTLRSMSFEEDGKEILIPTIVRENGEWKQLTDEEAIAWYHRTGEYLGKFDTVREADTYAEQLHRDQEDLYVNGKDKFTMGRAADWLQQQSDQLGEKAMENRRMAYTGASKGAQVAMDIGQTMIEMGFDAAVGAATGTGMLPMFTRVFGQEARQVRLAGGDINQQLGSGLTRAAIEVATEKLFDGVAGIFGKGAADDLVEDLIRELTVSRNGQNMLRFIAGSAGEGVEEWLADFFGVFSDMVWKNKSWREAYDDNMADALKDFLMGAAVGAIGGGAGVISDTVNQITGGKAGGNIGGYTEKNAQIQFNRDLEAAGVDPALYRQAAERELDPDKVSLTEKAELTQKEIKQMSAWMRGNHMLQQRQAKVMEEFRKEAMDAMKKRSTLSGTADLSNVTVKFDGVDVKMTGFVQENGKTMVQLELPSGKIFTAAPGKVEFYDKSADTQRMSPADQQKLLTGRFLEELSKQEHPEVMAMMYNPGQDVGEFINQWSVAERVYGRLAQNATVDTVLQAKELGGLTQEQIRAAFEVGRSELEQAKARTAVPEGVDVKSLRPGAGKVSYNGATVDGVKYDAVNLDTLNEAQQAQINMLETLASVTGVNIVFYQSQVNAQGYYEGANGLYRNGCIYIDVNAGLDQVLEDGRTVGEVAIVRTAAHELTHFIQDFNPAQYEKVRSFIIDTLLEEKGLDSLEDLIAEKQLRDRSGKLTREEAIDEVIADGCEMMLRDTKTIQKLAAEQPGIANRIRRWLSQWVKKIQAAFEGVDAKHREAQILMNHAEELQRLWDEAFENAARIAGSEYGRSDNQVRYEETAQEGGVKYMARDPRRVTREDVENLIRDCENGLYDNDTYIPVRVNTPGFLIEVIRKDTNGAVTVPNLPMVMKVEHMQQETEEADGSTMKGEKKPHQLKPEEVADLMERMNDPNRIVLQKNRRYAEIIHYKTKDGNQVVAAVEAGIERNPQNINQDLMNGFDGGTYNLLVTLYAPDNMDSYYKNKVERIVYDKNGDSQRGYGWPAPSHLNESPFYNPNIPQGDEESNNKLTDQELKDRQFEVVRNSNAAQDDIHTWIRSADEIKTFEEATADVEDSVTPDYGIQIIEEAKMTGRIRVYSAYKIREGTFVTPSKMEAQNYAGNGSVQEKWVALTDVAWIDEIEGQYTGDVTAKRSERENTLAEQNASEYNGRDPKLNRAVDLVRSGAQPSTIYNETGYVRMANGNLIDPDTGEIVWRYHNDISESSDEFSAGREEGREPETGVSGNDRRGLRGLDGETIPEGTGSGKKTGRAWRSLTEEVKGAITDTVTSYSKEHSSPELRAFRVSMTARQFAEKIYRIYREGRGLFEGDDTIKHLFRNPSSLYDELERTAGERAKHSERENEGQISLDEMTGGELSRSMLHPATREGLQRAADLKERIRDLFRNEGQAGLTDEELDDALFVDPDRGNRNIRMSDPLTVLRALSELSRETDLGERTRIYELMEELTGYMDPAAAERWTGMDENRKPNDTDFAEWYNERHPSLYYPGYKPGDLMNSLDAQVREREYLEELLRRDDLQEEDREQAEDFLRRLNPRTGTGEVFYSERDYGPDERDLVREYAARPDVHDEFLQQWLKKVQQSEALRMRLQDYDRSIGNLEERIRRAEAGELPMADPKKDREMLQKIRDSRDKVTERLNRLEKSILGMERRQEYKSAVERTRREWSGDPKETAKLIRELREMNRQLEEQVDYWKREGRITDPKERKARHSDVERYARDLAKQIGYKGNIADLIGMMQDAADLVLSEDLNWSDLQERTNAIARELTMNAVVEFDPEAGLRENLRERLRDLRIRPDESWTGDFGDWQDFRNRNFNKLFFSKEGENIDDVYQQLNGEFGDGLFPPDITAGSDQVYQILAALDRLQPVQYSAFRDSEELAMMTATMQNEITNTLLYGNIGEELTQADLDYRSLGERLQKLQEEARQNKKTIAEMQRAQHLEIRGALMAQRQQFKDREKKQKARARIQKTGLRLLKYLTENNGQKNPIPEPMKEAVGNLLMDLDLSGGLEAKRKKRYVRDMQAVQKIVMQQQAYMSGQSDAWSGMMLDLPADTIDQLNEHLERIQNAQERAEETGRVWNPYMMNAEELEQLDDILTVFTNAITKANEILSDARGGKISDAAARGVQYLNSLAPDRKKRTEKQEALNKFLRWQNTTPYYYFRKFGEPGIQMFEHIQDGWDKFAFNAQQIIEYAESVYTAEEARAIQDEVLTFKLRQRSDLSPGMEKNEEVTMTKAQVMSLYCLWKREQARGHIAGAGIRIADYKQGRGTVSQTENYLLDLMDVAQIIDTMTEREKEIADQLQKYMNTVGSEWGNEVSMKRFGIRSFTEENYFPITTDDRTRQVRNPESDTANLYRLLNMSFTKSTVRDASNAIVLDNIFDVFSNHMADMAKYNGLGLPMLDAMKWFSYTVLDEKDPESGQYGYESMQKAAERAYGKEARNYFVTFLKDLNGVREGGRGEEFGSKILSNYKVAAVGANLRVAVLQPTSYVRAAAVLDRKYLAQGIRMNNRQGREEAEQYSGTAVWKSLGFYDTNINAGLREMIKHTDGVREKIQDVSMKGAEMGDKITWGALWNACKAEQQAEAGGRISDSELMERTAKRFREVVYRTQVMDSTMTRSHVMRQKGVYAGMVTAFMSEPTVSFNMLLDAYGDYETKLRQGMNKSAAWQAAKGPITKAFGAYVATAVLSAVVESMIDAMRDDDEYATYAERWLEKLLGVNVKQRNLSFSDAVKGFFGGNLMDDLLVHNKLPIIKDFFATLTGGSATGRMDTEWMNNVVKALNIWKESIWLAAGWQEEPTKVTYSGNMTTWGKLYATLRAASQLSGLPVGNGMRDAVALWNSSVGEFAPGMKIQTYDPGEEKSIMYAVKDGYLTEDEAVRWMMHYELAKDETEARQKVFVWENSGKYSRLQEAVKAGDLDEALAAQEELMDLRFSPSSIQSAVKSAIQESYVEGLDGVRISKEEAARRLLEYGILKRDTDAQKQVEQWTSEVVTGIKYDDIDEAYVTGDIDRKRAEEMLQTYGSMTPEEAAAKVQQWSSEVETGIRYSEIGDAFLYGEITEQEAAQMYEKYGGKSPEDAALAARKVAFERDFGYSMERINIQADYADGGYTHDQMKKILLDYGYSKTEDSAESTVTRWDFVGQDWSLDSISGYEAQRYYNYNVDAAGISKEEWMDWLQIAKEADDAGQLSGDVKGISKKGAKIYVPYSKVDKILTLIDSFPISDQEKEALFLAGWDSGSEGNEKNLWRAPWRKRR